MTDREMEVSSALSPKNSAARVELIAPPNWTAIFFFACLAFLHLCIAIPAFLNKRWEGYMSACLACVFLVTTFVFYRTKCRVIVDSGRRQIRIHNGIGKFFYERVIGFADVHAVRLTFSPTDRPRSRIEILCDNEDIECPPTNVPRQEALCLAMLLRVELIKVWADQRLEEFDPETIESRRI